MFVKKFFKKVPYNVIWVNDEQKDYLVSKGYCVLSHSLNKWCFIKDYTIVHCLKQKGVYNG